MIKTSKNLSNTYIYIKFLKIFSRTNTILSSLVICLLYIILSNIILARNVANAAPNEILNAMQDEMQRSMNSLKLEDLQSPYYIEYILRVRQSFQAEASLGSVVRVNTGADKNAFLTVRLRVGSYKFDNTNFTNVSKEFFGSTTADDNERYVERPVPVDLTYNSLRRELWLASDAAYKDAAEAYSAKEAALKNIIRKDTTWDFSKTEVGTYIDTTAFPEININMFKEISKAASSVFLNYPEITNSSSDVGFYIERTYYLNSEGIKYIKDSKNAEINIAAVTQSEDGAPVYNYYNFIGFSPEDFPDVDSISRASKQVADKVISAMSAKTLDESYSGPMIFIGQAACELVAQAFAPNLIAQKDPTFGTGWEVSYGDGNYGNIKFFQNKIGARVLPEFMSVEDMPNLKTYQNVKLFGSYDFDEDGVKSQDLLLINNGYLKTLLSDRIPTKKIFVSNGHRRGGAINYSNLKITALKNKQKNEKELKAEMLKLCKKRNLPYGIIVKKITNKNVFNASIYRLAHDLFNYNMRKTILPLEVYKLYPDGREELLRDVEIGGMFAQTFKEILQVGNKHYVYNFIAAPANWNSDNTNVSIISPDLFFEDCELRIVEKDNKKLPILKNPLYKK